MTNRYRVIEVDGRWYAQVNMLPAWWPWERWRCIKHYLGPSVSNWDTIRRATEYTSLYAMHSKEGAVGLIEKYDRAQLSGEERVSRIINVEITDG